MKKPLRICAILHVFHEEFLDEILEYLKNLENISTFDLFVTMRPEIMHLAKNIENYFLKEKVNIKIIPFENLKGGADIWPFLYVVNNLDLDDYDIIFKLHTKHNPGNNYCVNFPKYFKNNVYCGFNLWRNFLLNEILGKDNVRKTLLIFQSDKYAGELGFMPYALKSGGIAVKIWSHKIKKVLKRYKFFAGTIFVIRANLLRIIQNIYTESDFETIQKDKKFSQSAYAFEGFLGGLVQIQKRKLKGVNPFSNPLILSLLSHKKLFPLFKFYCNKFIFKKELIK